MSLYGFPFYSILLNILAPLSYHLISLVCPFFQSLSIVTPGSPLLLFVFFTFLLHLFLFLSPPFSLFPFLFRPSSFAPPFLSFFSLFSFLLSFAPLLFGAPLRPPGGGARAPYAPQDTPLKTFQLLVTAS